MADLSILQQTLSVNFKDVSLLQQALTHRSFINEGNLPKIKSNERLEYLGDAVISLVIAERLYKLFPDAGEGELTRYRSSLVRKETLADISASLGLGSYLILGRGEESSGGRARQTNLASTLEAVIGAVYLENGCDLSRDLVLRLFQYKLDVISGGELFYDYKSELQKIALEKWQQIPVYSMTEEQGPDHDKEFTVEVRIDNRAVGWGKGKSKQAAEMEAAREALSKIRNNPPPSCNYRKGE